MAEELNIKPLNTSHFWQLISMIRKGGKEAIMTLQQMAVREAAEKKLAEEQGKEWGENEKKQLEMERGMVIFDIAMQHAERDLKAMFADLAGMTLEEYEAARFDLTFDIIEHLIEKEDLAGFFRRAANFAQKIRSTKQTA